MTQKTTPGSARPRAARPLRAGIARLTAPLASATG